VNRFAILIRAPLRLLILIPNVHRARFTISLRNKPSEMMDSVEDYSTWGSEKLIDRVVFLEQQLREQSTR
jgi:hypothetical protein